MYEHVIGFTVFYLCTVMGDKILQEHFEKTPFYLTNITRPSYVNGNSVPPSNVYRKFDIPQQEQKPEACKNSQFLISILNNLLKILSDGKERLPPRIIEEINKELDLIQRYIIEMPNSAGNYEILEKFRRLREQFIKESEALVKPLDEDLGDTKINVIFKYEIPSIQHLKCRQALIKLMEIANSAYINILNHPICQGTDIGVQNNKPVNGNYLQNVIDFTHFQPQIPTNNQGFVLSNQQYQTNLYGQVGPDSNVKPFSNINSQNVVNSQKNQSPISEFSQNHVNSQKIQSSNIVSNNLNSQLLVQPLQLHQPYIQSTNNLQQAVGHNSGYQFNKIFKQPLQPGIIYSKNNIQTPIEQNSPNLSPNNYKYYNPIIKIPNFYLTSYLSTVADSPYSNINFPTSPPNIKPTSPLLVDQEKENFNNIFYNSNEGELTNNLQHAKYVAESMAHAIKALHVSQNFAGKNISSIQNYNNLLLNNADQFPVTVPTNEESVSYQTYYPVHAELLNVHYQKIPLRETDNQVEDPTLQQLDNGNKNHVITPYEKNHKRNNLIEQENGLKDENDVKYGFGQSLSPASLTGPFDGNDLFKLPTSLPNANSDTHNSLNPIIQNTATFNVKNEDLSSTSSQIQEPRTSSISNPFLKDMLSSYPYWQTNNNLNQYQNSNVNPNDNSNANHFENNFPKLSVELQHLNSIQNQLPDYSINKNPNSPNNQVEFQNVNKIQVTPANFIPNQMQNFDYLQNESPKFSSNQMQNEICGFYPVLCNKNPNLNQNHFFDPSQIQNQKSPWNQQNINSNQVQNVQTQKPNLLEYNLYPDHLNLPEYNPTPGNLNPLNNNNNQQPPGPSHPQPSYPHAHNANNFFNIASQNGQLYNSQQFNAPPSQLSYHLGQNHYPQAQPQNQEKEIGATQRFFDSITNNVQSNSNFIPQPKPLSMDFQPPITPKPQSMVQQLHISDQRTSFINSLQQDFNSIPQKYDGSMSLNKWFGVTNLYKLNYVNNKRDLIELTYLLQRPNPMLYQPFYIVKYAVPYLTYLNHLRKSLQNRPHLRSDPAQLYNELIPESNITEVSPDLKYFDDNSLKKWALQNGSLYKATIINNNLTSVDDHVKMVHDMTSDMPQENFVKILDDMIKNNNKSEANEDNRQSSDFSFKPTEDSFKKEALYNSNQVKNLHDSKNQKNSNHFMLPLSYKQSQYNHQMVPQNVEGSTYNYPVPLAPQYYPPLLQNYPSIQNYPVLKNYLPSHNYPIPQNPPPHNYPAPYNLTQTNHPLQNSPSTQNYPTLQNYHTPTNAEA